MIIIIIIKIVIKSHYWELPGHLEWFLKPKELVEPGFKHIPVRLI